MEFTGRVDQCDREGIRGWVASTAEAAKRLEIEVVADGKSVARAVANEFRPDLATAGIGDGLHGFKVTLPAALFDDNEHILEVREVSTGYVLQGSPRTFRATLAGHGSIRLRGSALIGWASAPQGFESAPALEVMDGEQAIGVVEGAVDGAVADVVHFRFPLPPSVLDGYLHHFSIRSMPGRNPPVPLGNLTVVTPVRPGLASASHQRERGVAEADSADADNLRAGEYAPPMGQIEGVSRGVVFGWAVGGPGAAQARLEFLLDGIQAGTVDPTVMRADIEGAAGVGYRCGFRFDLKPHLGALTGQELVVRDGASGATLTPIPIRLERAATWGAVDGVYGMEVRGWAVRCGLESEALSVEVLIDGEVAGCAPVNRTLSALARKSLPHPRSGFSLLIPPRWHDGQRHTVTARVLGQDRELSGSGVEFKCRVESHIDVFVSNQVSGWIVNVAAPEHPVTFDLWINGHCAKKNVVPNLVRRDVDSTLIASKGSGHLTGFDVLLPPPHPKWTGKLDYLELCLPGTRDRLLGRNAVAVGRLDLLQHLERLMSRLCADSAGDITAQPSSALNLALRTEFMPEIIATLRKGSFDQAVLVRPAAPQSQRGASRESERVDVIIPVYKGYRETLACIHSVLATRDETPMELVVIDDCSPDARLSAALRRLAAAEGFTLLANERNRGFVATVNIGMRLHRERDIVLLNSDTVVPRGWLTALRRAAYAAPNIGTVTPLSNRATIFSLPRACYDNDMPLGLSVDEVNALCADRNSGVIVDVPTGVGFCMYVRRQTLNEVGLFDEERWGKGYGEENDFCLSATALGWRNVAACDVFVQHHGAVSFDSEKDARITENLAKLNEFYPDYSLRIQRYVDSDPLAAARGRVNMALVKRLGTGYVLFVTHGVGGGTETAVRELVRLLARDGKKALILRSQPSGAMLLAPAAASHEETLVTTYPRETGVELLAEHLRELAVEYVHFHHTHAFRIDIWRLPELLGVPYDVMIHDFYMACPRVNLIDESGIYCGQPDVAACERCVKSKPMDHNSEAQLVEAGGTVAQWRQFHAGRLIKARRVVTPSGNARAHFRKSLPIDTIQVVPHPEPAFSFERRPWNGSLPHRVAVLGAIGPHKGSHLLLACARFALRESLPLRFVIIGYTDRDQELAELDNVEITGRYEANGLRSMVETSGCTTALFLSVWPETYSYTLSEAWRLGLYPVALDIGAPAERIREGGTGTLVPLTQNPAEIVTTLLRVLDAQQPDSSVL